VRLLSLARDLRRRRARDRQGLFVAEGVRAVEELLRSPLTVVGALVGPHLDATPRGAQLRATLAERGVAVLDVGDREFASAADTDTPQGVLAVAEVPRRTPEALDLPAGARLLLLDAIQDPGNVGTMLRTAAAMGAAATVALPGTVDLWNAKVVRGAMGALFQHPALSLTWEELDAFLPGREVVLWGADARGEPVERAVADAPPRLAVVVGNEGAGLSAEARGRADRLVALRIAPGVESLNVAVAAGVLLYLLRA
jgi:RNA methyltransferase, TrmH family